MSRMIDMIKQSAVPANMMRSAARGALTLPGPEIVEILVYLSGHPMFGEQAKLTLAGFDVETVQQVAADPATPLEVLQYLSDPKNVRAGVLPMLLENPALPVAAVLALAESHSQTVLSAMAASKRVQSQSAALQVLMDNPELPPEKKALLEPALLKVQSQSSEDVLGIDDEDVLGIDEEVKKYMDLHAAEIAAEMEAEAAKGFALVDLTEDEKKEILAERAAKKKEEQGRLSPLQKIAGLNVGDRVQLAMKGNREERYILIRDGCKLVSSGVLECPKLTDQEVEMFAGMKNVQESVLRAIAGKRKFLKLYTVVRNLSSNPRCPIDVGLPLLKGLLVTDLRNLSMNKNISDTLRKVALKMYKEKSSNKRND